MSTQTTERAVAELRAEQQQLLERYGLLEEQSATLATLYVACQRLHSSLQRDEVLLTVREIIANLIGCEQYALFTLRSDGELHLADSFGLEPSLCEQLWPGRGLIGRAVETGQIVLRGEGDERMAAEIEADLTACIPLKRDGTVTGAVALFRLLPQKFELGDLDRELFRLLETQLAIALHCVDLQEQVDRNQGVGA